MVIATTLMLNFASLFRSEMMAQVSVDAVKFHEYTERYIDYTISPSRPGSQSIITGVGLSDMFTLPQLNEL